MIRAGAPPLAELRPDLPGDRCALVDRMLDVDPRRGPPRSSSPNALRQAFAESRRRPRPAASLSSLRERALHAGLAAAFATVCAPACSRSSRAAGRSVAALAACGGAALAARRPRARPGRSRAPAREHLARARDRVRPVAAGWFALFARQRPNGLLFLAGAAARAARQPRSRPARGAGRGGPHPPGRRRRRRRLLRGRVRGARRRGVPARRAAGEPDARRDRPAGHRGVGRGRLARRAADALHRRGRPRRRLADAPPRPPKRTLGDRLLGLGLRRGDPARPARRGHDGERTRARPGDLGRRGLALGAAATPRRGARNRARSADPFPAPGL